MRRRAALSDLAINGGPKVRTRPWPGRALFGPEERAAVDALFAEAARQIGKLPAIVARRRSLVAQLSEGLHELQAVSIPPVLSGAEPSYWFWRLRVPAERLTCDKDTFCRALQAEGLPLNPRYEAMPHTQEWFWQRRVFGTSGYPWTSPLYGGDPDREFLTPNARAAVDAHFNLQLFETWGPAEAADILTAFHKVEAVFLR